MIFLPRRNNLFAKIHFFGYTRVKSVSKTFFFYCNTIKFWHNNTHIPTLYSYKIRAKGMPLRTDYK